MESETNSQEEAQEQYGDSNRLDVRNQIQQQYRTHTKPWFQWVFDHFSLPKSCRILELGGGSGALWEQNLKRISKGWRITVSDLSSGMMRDAKEQSSARGHAFVALDGQHLPFPDNHFDCVLAIGVLDAVPDLDRALREARQALKPGGLLVASAGGASHLIELRRMMRPFLPEDKIEQLGGDERHFGLQNGASHLGKQFADVVRYDYDDTLVFEEVQPVLDYVLSEKAMVRDMTPEQLRRFEQHVRDLLEAEGQIRVTVEKGLFIAKKA